MKPMRNLILIEKEDEEKKSASGLLIREAWSKPEIKATILAIGPAVESVEVGQKVVINPYAVIDTPIKNQKLIKESDILAWAE